MLKSARWLIDSSLESSLFLSLCWFQGIWACNPTVAQRICSITAAEDSALFSRYCNRCLWTSDTTVSQLLVGRVAVVAVSVSVTSFTCFHRLLQQLIRHGPSLHALETMRHLADRDLISEVDILQFISRCIVDCCMCTVRCRGCKGDSSVCLESLPQDNPRHKLRAPKPHECCRSLLQRSSLLCSLFLPGRMCQSKGARWRCSVLSYRVSSTHRVQQV